MNENRPDPEEPTVPDAWRLTRFFIPLAVQAASQSLCYPLVAMVASRGPGGPLDLAGLAQSNIVLFFLGISMISLVPTGMVYAQTREGYRRFYRLTMTIGGAMTAIQALLCIPALSHALFAQLIGLPPSIEAPAQSTLLLSIPLQVIFFSRIPYFVVLYIGRATGVASIATIGRVVLTAALSPLFCLAGLVGPLWAVVALTIPVALEAFASGCFAQRFIRALPPSPGDPPGLREILWFNPRSPWGAIFSCWRPSPLRRSSRGRPTQSGCCRPITWPSAWSTRWLLPRPASRPSCWRLHRRRRSSDARCASPWRPA